MELGVPASLRSGELQLHEAVASGVPRELWSRECVGAEVKCPVAPLLVARCAWWPELGAGGGGADTDTRARQQPPGNLRRH